MSAMNSVALKQQTFQLYVSPFEFRESDQTRQAMEHNETLLLQSIFAARRWVDKSSRMVAVGLIVRRR